MIATTDESSSMSQTPRCSLSALTASVWGLSFGIVHVAWSLGSRFGLHDAAAADAAFEQTWFHLYNLTVAVASFVAAAAALLLASPRPTWSRLAWAVACTAGALLFVRGAIGAAELAFLTATDGARGPLRAWAVDGYMLGGGSVFLLAAWRAPRPAWRDRSPGTGTCPR